MDDPQRRPRHDHHLHVCLSAAERAALDEAAQRLDLSRSQLVRRAIRELLRAEGKRRG